MGYSISVLCRNKQLKDKMFRFMELYYRDIPSLYRAYNHLDGSTDYIPDYSYSYFSDDLSYDHHKNVLGFDYGACGIYERHYIYSVLYWMSLKVGKRIKKDGLLTHYYLYDGCDLCYIYLNDDGYKNDGVVLEKNGIYNSVLNNELVKYEMDHDPEENEYFILFFDKIVELEINRLNAIWENF